MAAKPSSPRRALLLRFVGSPWGRAFLISFLVLCTLSVGVFTYYYSKYARIIEDKLRNGPFANTSMLYAAPQPVMVGDQTQASEITDYLQRAGYTESNRNRLGWYHVRPDAVEINPGPEAYDGEGAVIKIESGRVTHIISLRDQSERTQYDLEPEPITNLFDQKREKRRLVRFADIPKVMVDAVLSAEDKHFFQHAGFDPMGIARAVLVDIKDRRGSQGASTLTQQLARTLWLGPERGWRRKIPETLITLHLEQQLTKQQIFEDYANAIYLGHQGSFSIHGFGEAASVYLAKDLSQVTPADAALLAGLVQSPIGRNPFRYPDRARVRRNLVLKAMRENGYLTEQQYQDAAASALHVVQGAAESTDAPFFVDLVDETLQNRFQDYDFQNNSFRVYTTLDMTLQRDAVEAVRIGIQETDAQWKHRSKKYGTDEMPLAQVAMVVLDTETGKVKALVGGRSYANSQLNHATAKRQPGSSFKPFVYTAAFSAALQDGGQVITPDTTVEDEPTTFMYDDKPYEPADFGDEYAGTVTLRRALAHSLNIPAVKVAEMVGYDKVAATARAVGLNLDIQPTPSIALGAYEVMPIEIAGAYTVFPNGGVLKKPGYIDTIRSQDGRVVYRNMPQEKQAIDPRVAYLMTNMMEEVLRTGTAAGVRGRGFVLPAAGKTGTSRDGWFAGFTSKLICVVWVGFDDNRDFKLEGARSALPIWTEFMKRAHQHREYRNVHEFEAPEGVVTADIDADNGLLATPGCPKVRSEVFIAGTQPVEACRLHGGGRTQVAGWDPVAPAAEQRNPVVAQTAKPAAAPATSISITPATPPQAEQPKKSRGFFGRLKDIFK
ncbi:MAG TPA: PBP1A family penicillin-binding protein [Bryobacteraceae bacterium]|nr:PBP1A family penicillin-binding protein [Bryobacteraceae bacterium]